MKTPSLRWASAAALALLVVAAALRHPGAVSARVALDLLADNAVLGIAALGATLVIVSGGIDLSIGASMALASTVVAVLLEKHGLSPAPAFGLALALGALFGAAMGALIHFLALPPFLVTLAGMFLARGIALRLHVESLAIAHPSYERLTAAGIRFAPGVTLTLGAMLFVLALALSSWLLRQTRLGRDVYAVGGNAEAALLAGVNVARTRIAVYALGGAASALAGIAYTLYGSAGSSTAGSGLELEAIAAVVLGGARISGGVGGALGTLLGVLVLGVIQLALIFEGAPGAGWTRVAIGALLLAFLALQRAFDSRAPALRG